MNKKTPTEKFREQAPLLPPKDASLAMQFIEKRDFERLHELVSANVTILEKKCKVCSLEGDDLRNELKLNDLCKFKTDIESYLYLLGYTTDDIDDYSDDADLTEGCYLSEDFYD